MELVATADLLPVLPVAGIGKVVGIVIVLVVVAAILSRVLGGRRRI